MKKIILLFVLIANISFSYSQGIPEHISHQGIYDFLDEMASEKIIAINTTVKPYSRDFIAQKLKEEIDLRK